MHWHKKSYWATGYSNTVPMAISLANRLRVSWEHELNELEHITFCIYLVII